MTLLCLYWAAAAFVSYTQARPTCNSDTFGSLELADSEIKSVDAVLTNVTIGDSALNAYPPNSSAPAETCQLTIQHNHPGWNDTLTTWVWLPASDWNGRLVALGGGGWTTGSTEDMPWPISQGYVAVSTDGGHSGSDLNWTVESRGNINWYLLQDFAARSLDDAATLGKAAAAAYFGRWPEYSYWNACPAILVLDQTATNSPL